jgi:hypothetical protein
MESSDPLERRRGWENFLEPLYTRSNHEMPEVEFEDYRQKYQDALRELEAQARTRSADVQTDAEWAYLCSRRLEGIGEQDAANRILHAIVIAYRDQPL